ncbi:hypothetical protein E2C01_042422 [Portunus trituberculatus]|uniref:Uncharacterized protein n=1 Tax=Portunus trituberculatus TaxID=210409 RepID=A0A5B7FLU8_PORTR|nr:hypothetical protein [Portunus trituberculatus]
MVLASMLASMPPLPIAHAAPHTGVYVDRRTGKHASSSTAMSKIEKLTGKEIDNAVYIVFILAMARCNDSY